MYAPRRSHWKKLSAFAIGSLAVLLSIIAIRAVWLSSEASRTYVTGVEAAQHNLTLQTISRLADALGVPVCDFFLTAAVANGEADKVAREKPASLRGTRPAQLQAVRLFGRQFWSFAGNH